MYVMGLLKFLEDFLHVAGDYPTVDLLADEDDGREPAGTHAAEAGEGEFPVGGGFTNVDVQ